jgi:hypothetical protein
MVEFSIQNEVRIVPPLGSGKNACGPSADTFPILQGSLAKILAAQIGSDHPCPLLVLPRPADQRGTMILISMTHTVLAKLMGPGVPPSARY